MTQFAIPQPNLAFSPLPKTICVRAWLWRPTASISFRPHAPNGHLSTAMQQRIICREISPPKDKDLGSQDEDARRLHEPMDYNEAFDAAIETLEGDRSIRDAADRQRIPRICCAESRVRPPAIRRRQSSNVKCWEERCLPTEIRVGIPPSRPPCKIRPVWFLRHDSPRRPKVM